MDAILTQILVHGGPVGVVAVAFTVVHIWTLRYLVSNERKKHARLVRALKVGLNQTGQILEAVVSRLEHLEQKLDGAPAQKQRSW